VIATQPLAKSLAAGEVVVRELAMPMRL